MRLLPVFLCFLAVVFASCGGGGGGGGGSETATPGTTGTVSPEAHETAEASIPDPFASLSSYDYDIKVLADGQLQVEIQGAVQGSDRIEANFIVSGSTTPIESVIIIGSQAWINDSSTENQWALTDLGTAQNTLAGAPPKDIWNLLTVDQLLSGANDLGEENVNGVASHHFQVGSLSSDAQTTLSSFLGVTIGSSGTIDIWRADNGNWPVKAKITGQFQNGETTSTAETDWDVTNVNSATVQPPPQ